MDGVSFFEHLMKPSYAILVDGGFMRVRLQVKNRHFPTVAEVSAEIDRIKSIAELQEHELLRVYYYDAPPAIGTLTNPIDQTRLDLSQHPQYAQNFGLQQALEMLPDFALRSGEMSVDGWALGSAALHNLTAGGPRVITARDLVPNISPEGRGSAHWPRHRKVVAPPTGPRPRRGHRRQRHDPGLQVRTARRGARLS
nr:MULTISPECIES: hypothetical protein [unclassified Devosia]